MLLRQATPRFSTIVWEAALYNTGFCDTQTGAYSSVHYGEKRIMQRQAAIRHGKLAASHALEPYIVNRNPVVN